MVRTDQSFAPRTVFTRTTAGVTADLFAIVDTFPIAHLRVEGHKSQFAQALGTRLVLEPGHEFIVQFLQLGLQDEDEVPQAGQHAQHPGIQTGQLGPVARAPPAMRQLEMAILGDLPVPAVGQATDLAGQELTAAGAGAAVLFGQAGNADGREFVHVAVQPAGQAQAQGPGSELVGLAFAVKGNGG